MQLLLFTSFGYVPDNVKYRGMDFKVVGGK